MDTYWSKCKLKDISVHPYRREIYNEKQSPLLVDLDELSETACNYLLNSCPIILTKKNECISGLRTYLLAAKKFPPFTEVDILYLQSSSKDKIQFYCEADTLLPHLLLSTKSQSQSLYDAARKVSEENLEVWIPEAVPISRTRFGKLIGASHHKLKD